MPELIGHPVFCIFWTPAFAMVTWIPYLESLSRLVIPAQAGIQFF